MYCANCGNILKTSDRFCAHCGSEIRSQNRQGDASTENKAPDIPDGVKGWSWAGFLIAPLWAAGNRVWWGILGSLPVIGIGIGIWLGLKGREMAWRRGKWESAEQFNRVQRRWSICAFILIPLAGTLLVFREPLINWIVETQAPSPASEARPMDVASPPEAGNQANIKSEIVTEADTSPIPKNPSSEEKAAYGRISNSITIVLKRVEERGAFPAPLFSSAADKNMYLNWREIMSDRLKGKIVDKAARHELLDVVWYEAKRAGLDPALVLGIIQVESDFVRNSVSNDYGRGYMGVHPAWASVIGDGDEAKLMKLQINLRYGCEILRMYLDLEEGNLFTALGRMKGKRGEPEYPNAVLAAWKQYESN